MPTNFNDVPSSLNFDDEDTPAQLPNKPNFVADNWSAQFTPPGPLDDMKKAKVDIQIGKEKKKIKPWFPF